MTFWSRFTATRGSSSAISVSVGPVSSVDLQQQSYLPPQPLSNLPPFSAIFRITRNSAHARPRCERRHCKCSLPFRSFSLSTIEIILAPSGFCSRFPPFIYSALFLSLYGHIEAGYALPMSGFSGQNCIQYSMNRIRGCDVSRWLPKWQPKSLLSLQKITSIPDSTSYIHSHTYSCALVCAPQHEYPPHPSPTPIQWN